MFLFYDTKSIFPIVSKNLGIIDIFWGSCQIAVGPNMAHGVIHDMIKKLKAILILWKYMVMALNRNPIFMTS